jgi:uncharacterized membrane protein
VAFALSMIPLCAMLGVTIDYLRASTLRLDLQGVVDAAVLAAGAEGGDDEAALRNTISLYIDANLRTADREALGAIRVSFGKSATSGSRRRPPPGTRSSSLSASGRRRLPWQARRCGRIRSKPRWCWTTPAR